LNYWQISAGDGQVDLVDIFLKLNVALLGPGRYGDYFDNRASYVELSDGHLIKKFAEDVQVGDVFVLKHIVDPNRKTWHIIAVGEVVGPYRYEPIFNSVDSNEWDVQHCRRVVWWEPKETLIVQGGGAPIRLQRLGDQNPLKIKADEIFDRKIECIE
jgi:predicted Mrr-cat superfamily restriction endonuclease